MPARSVARFPLVKKRHYCREHLVDDFGKCWQNPLSNGEFDSAVCDTGVSRWTNFYIEGLNISTAAAPKIDGIYYDGILFPRETMLRIRRVLSANKGDQGLIDLHSGNFSDGGPALSYMMFFRAATPFLDVVALAVSLTRKACAVSAYIDSLWFGESFHYNSPADTFLVEISGLPFGLFGDMLGGEKHGAAHVDWIGPNLYRGMGKQAHPFLILLGRWLSLAN